MSNIIERILQIIEYKGISKRQFCSSINVSPGFFNTLRDNVSSSALEKILKIYPEIDPVWLLTGNGEMTITPRQRWQNIDNKDFTAALEWLLFDGKLEKGAFLSLSDEFERLSSLMNIIHENFIADLSLYTFHELTRKEDKNIAPADKSFFNKYKDCYLEVSDYIKKIKEEINKSPDLIKEPDEERER